MRTVSLILVALASAYALPSPYPLQTPSLLSISKRNSPGPYVPSDIPTFPATIPSCVVCEPAWGGISSCAAAAAVFQDFKSVLYNPLAFVSEIKCACADTFQSAYPQCVDCFVQTNQCPEYLGVPSQSNASSVLDGIRQVCGFGSALLGGVAASQTAVNISYTYTGVPSQGYPTTTAYGPGGIDVGGAGGAARSDGVRISSSMSVLIASGVALVVFG